MKIQLTFTKEDIKKSSGESYRHELEYDAVIQAFKRLNISYLKDVGLGIIDMRTCTVIQPTGYERMMNIIVDHLYGTDILYDITLTMDLDIPDYILEEEYELINKLS